jgi:predicted amidohydrolase
VQTASAEQAEQLSVAVCQLTSVDDVATNVSQILEILKQLQSHPPDLICLPENALFLRVMEGADVPAIDLKCKEIQRLANWAKEYGSFLHLGSVPLLRAGNLYNSSVLISADGSLQDCYQKIHLFDVDVHGQKRIRESDVFAAGSTPSVFEIKGWRFGSSICYDVRFAELFLHYAKMPVDVLLVPAAFLVPTGQAHWEVLTRARAIECQAYLLASAQGGVHNGISGGMRSTFGHSMIVDPWGTVLDVIDDSTSGRHVLHATLLRQKIRDVRKQIPMGSHRRI